MKHYSSTYAYPSLFDRTRLFATVEEVRVFDRAHAAAVIGRTTAEDVAKSLEGVGAREMREVIAFLHEELPHMNVAADER